MHAWWQGWWWLSRPPAGSYFFTSDATPAKSASAVNGCPPGVSQERQRSPHDQRHQGQPVPGPARRVGIGAIHPLPTRTRTAEFRMNTPGQASAPGQVARRQRYQTRGRIARATLPSGRLSASADRRTETHQSRARTGLRKLPAGPMPWQV